MFWSQTQLSSHARVLRLCDIWKEKGVPPHRNDETVKWEWCPYHTSDSTWHSAGIKDSLVIFFSVLIVTQTILANYRELDAENTYEVEKHHKDCLHLGGQNVNECKVIYKGCALVSSGCHNKRPENGQLNRHILPQEARGPDPGPSLLVPGEILLPGW